MNGKQLLEIFPDAILKNAEPDRIERLKKCESEEKFTEELRLLTKKSRPYWIYGFPRTGSSWLCKHFFGKLEKVTYFEPYQLFQCNSVPETTEYINYQSNWQTKRQKILKILKIYNTPLDRILLAVHKKFIFKFLFDFNIADKLIELFPRSRFIWLIRDGRDAVESFAFPNTGHWPPAAFEYLGKEPKERLLGAIGRLINYSNAQFQILKMFKQRIYLLKYETFTQDFISTSRKLLKFTRTSYSDEVLEELKSNFKARHGMWKNWENWKKDYFKHTGALKINSMLKYGNKTEDSIFVWEQPL